MQSRDLEIARLQSLKLDAATLEETPSSHDAGPARERMAGVGGAMVVEAHARVHLCGLDPSAVLASMLPPDY
jgi:hypothetical protein